MDNFVNWMETNQGVIKLTMSSIIAVVSVIVVSLLIIKAITAAKNSKMNEVAKHVGYAAIVVLLTILGIGGVFALVNAIAPNESILPRGDGTILMQVVSGTDEI